ncbi:MAG: alpha/beta fold hydrolase [Acidobacteriaceae bacterium]|nr:alpha/beta fold hydrolase [Acidobacteriaceae bacterium]
MPILSANPMWEMFGQRALSHIIYGAADIGECVSTVGRVTGDSPEDWYREWNRTAERLFAAARMSEDAGHLVSAREAYFRAATYYRVSYLPLFGDPVDPWLSGAFACESDAFHRAARLNNFPIEPVEVPFENQSLPAYFVTPAWDGVKRPTILHIDGYDGNIHEMYFAHGPAAARRGYNCLLLDGPGQGRNLIRDRMPMRPDWECVVKAAVDYLLTRPDVDSERIILAGWSFGGFLAPRAAAFEKRIAALVADPGQWDQKPDLRMFHLPPEVAEHFPHVDPTLFDPIEQHLRSPAADPILRWKVIQRGLWVHGVPSLYDLACELGRFEISSVASEISCPTLLTAADDDPVAAGAATLYETLRCPKRLVRFTAAEGAGGHCEALSRALYHQRVFDWLDEVVTAKPLAQAAFPETPLLRQRSAIKLVHTSHLD